MNQASPPDLIAGSLHLHVSVHCRANSLEIDMVALHILQGRLGKELGNIPAIPHVVHDTLPAEQLQCKNSSISVVG